MGSLWKTHAIVCALAAAALTTFLMHLGAVDPWMGGIAVPAMVWIAWVVVDLIRASRRIRHTPKSPALRE